MQLNQKLKTANGTEVFLYPMSYGYISQGTHTSNGIDYNAYDLAGRENAAGKNEEVFAPCSMTIVYSQLNAPQYTNTIIFVSDNPVLLADGTISRVAILMAHCEDIRGFVNKNSFNQGELCYYEGTFDNGVGALSTHLHIEVTKVGLDGKYQTLASPFSLVNSLPLEKVFYTNGTDVTGGANVGNLNSYGFKAYSTTPFNPVGKPNGWNEYNGEWYYVRNGQCVTGWFQEGSNWYYLEADGKMKKGWLASGNDWFYLSPGSGVMQVNTFVDDDKFYVGADGKMVRTGWTLIGSNYYYFKDKNRDTDSRYAAFADGQKVTSTWIPGSSWFYVLSNGIMAKNCQIRENEKYFAFNNSGACLNSSGQSTAYNTTTYPIRS